MPRRPRNRRAGRVARKIPRRPPPRRTAIRIRRIRADREPCFPTTGGEPPVRYALTGLGGDDVEAARALLLARGADVLAQSNDGLIFAARDEDLASLADHPLFRDSIHKILRALRGPDREAWLRAWRLPADARGTLFLGVLNVTPDSFSDGGLYAAPEEAAARGAALAREGADAIDIGGESTRPGAAEVPEEEEIRRTVPVIRALTAESAVPLSIDTRKSAVAEAALRAGATIVNDVTGLGHDGALARVAAERGAGLVLGHIRGTPRDMQTNPRYDDAVAEVYDELGRSVEAALAAGVAEEAIAVDPGIGFGKRLEDNLRLLRHLSEIRSLGFPIIVGPSRKSFVGAILDLPVGDRLEGTIGASVAAALHGADMLRVHDVEAVRRAVRVAEAIEDA